MRAISNAWLCVFFLLRSIFDYCIIDFAFVLRCLSPVCFFFFSWLLLPFFDSKESSRKREEINFNDTYSQERKKKRLKYFSSHFVPATIHSARMSFWTPLLPLLFRFVQLKMAFWLFVCVCVCVNIHKTGCNKQQIAYISKSTLNDRIFCFAQIHRCCNTHSLARRVYIYTIKRRL